MPTADNEMERTLIRDIRSKVGYEAKIQGWVVAVRDQKSIQFVIVRDHSGWVQVTVQRTAQNEWLNDLVSSLTRESTVTVVGTVVENPDVKAGGIEILPRELKLASRADGILPLDPLVASEVGSEVRLNWRFLDLRRPENLLTFQVQTYLLGAMRHFLLINNFLEIQSPKLMGTASESGAEVFEVNYFGRTAYLAQSPQFYKQMAMAAGFDRVFEVGPAFRADPSFTAQHSTEFTSIDVEMSWIESHEEVMTFEELWLHHSLSGVRELFGENIRRTFNVEVKVPGTPFPRISMRDAQEIVKRKGHTLPPERKGDLDPTGERILAEYVYEQSGGHEFVFITDYPASVRPFYHMRYESDTETTKSFDLLWFGVEITTGAQREHRYDFLQRQAREKFIHLEPIQFYLDFFRYGCPPHGGFGFGLARMLMVLLRRSSIRDVTYLFRGPTRLHP